MLSEHGTKLIHHVLFYDDCSKPVQVPHHQRSPIRARHNPLSLTFDQIIVLLAIATPDP